MNSESDLDIINAEIIEKSIPKESIRVKTDEEFL